MDRIGEDHILAGAAFTVSLDLVRGIAMLDKAPEAGDLVCGRVERLGEYAILEDKKGQILPISDGTRAIFVFGNRYATDVFEGIVPDHLPRQLDLLSRSGVVGVMRQRNALAEDPTRIQVEGFACDAQGHVLNTREHCKIRPGPETEGGARAKMILSIGTAMSSGKSTTAAACCWALRTSGHTVSAAKITGTASRRDIFLMRDGGAHPVAEFSDLGYPSTHLLPEEEVIEIFRRLDLGLANSDKDFWVAEIADGILQRETAILLRSEAVRSRIHRLIFSANDALGAIGGLMILGDKFDLVPDAISGICSSSPLGVMELRGITEIPVFDNVRRDLKQIVSTLL